MMECIDAEVNVGSTVFGAFNSESRNRSRKMKLFSGFPAGRLQVTPLPNLFFSELLPSIDDLAELKVTLHLFWLLANRKLRVLHVRASELAADRTLMQSLAVVDAQPGETLKRALALAVERGTLLHLSAHFGEENATEDFYFMNSEGGRRAFEEMERTTPPGETMPSSDPTIRVDRPNIFTLYEQNIGLLTPLLAEDLKEAEREYPADWIEDAFRIALKRNVRRWDYISAILKRWKTEGRVTESKKSKHWWDDEYDKFINR